VLGRGDRQIRHFLTDVLERLLGLGVDVLARLLEQILARPAGILERVALGLCTGLLRVRDDLVGLRASLLEPLAVLLEQRVGLGAVGAGIGIGQIFAAVIEATTRQPEMRDEITSIQWLGFALTEACFFYGLVAGLIAFFL